MDGHVRGWQYARRLMEHRVCNLENEIDGQAPLLEDMILTPHKQCAQS